MFIAVKELELHKLQFSEDFGPGTVDFRTGEFRQVGALHVEGEAALVGSEIQIVGRLAIRVEMSCARCLEPVDRDIAAGFDLLYRPIGTIGASTERELGDEDLNVGFYRGGGLFLADVLVEQVHLALPMKVVCREECQGLCPRCGANLNREHCRCGPKVMDPRLAPLADWAARKKKS
jgi:uncharacterized protein